MKVKSIQSKGWYERTLFDVVPGTAIYGYSLAFPSVTIPMLALDPGGTTGFAYWLDDLIWIGQIPGRHESTRILFDDIDPKLVICEDYRIYASKAADQINSRVETIRLIGGIEMLCSMASIPTVWQMASEGKGFFTDEKIKEIGLYVRGKPHAMDALRHLLHFYTFKWKGSPNASMPPANL